MSKELSTSIIINASTQKVWKTLVDFKSYPNWNPFIKSIDGNVEVGKTIKARIEPPGATGMTFKPIVLAFTPYDEFRWKGKLFISGIFDGEHSFKLLDNKNGTTTFIQSEKFNGILVPLFKNMLNINTINGFNLMNQKLKEICENTI